MTVASAAELEKATAGGQTYALGYFKAFEVPLEPFYQLSI